MKIALLQTPAVTLNIEVHGGLETVELAELDFLIARGYSAKLFASKVEGAKPNVFQLKDFGFQRRILKIVYYVMFGIKNRKADIFHGHYTPILALLFPKKSLVHFHGLAVVELPLFRYRFIRKRYQEAHYVFCARWVKDQFRTLYPDIPESQLSVLYNGADISRIFPPENKKIGAVVNICFYAGWIPIKGIYDVLQAVELVYRKRKDFKLWFGGSAHSHYRTWGNADEIDHKVRAWAARLPCVELVGNIRYSELPDFLRRMDLGVVPSTYKDPFPVVPLEMMAAGLPVIAYAIGGLLESVVDGYTGFLVENQKPELIAEKIEYFLDNPDQLLLKGRNARKHIEKHFTWNHHTDELVKIYRAIIEESL